MEPARPVRPVRTGPPPAWPDAAPPADAAWPLIGRDDVVSALVADLVASDGRAIVLSGLGGVGKTRLAAEVARDVARRLAGRVAWIALGPAPRDVALAPAIASGLGVAHLEPGRAADDIAEALGEDPVLLVLDAAETALADLGLVDNLLDRLPHLRLIVTSRIAIERERLDVRPVEPLEVPNAGDDPEAIAESPAVSLLVDRGRRAGADVTLNARTAPAMARLVARLDGLPLAIELAAPLLRALPPHRLLERIGGQLDPIVATIDWGHSQLAADDRILYRRVSVFGVPFRARHVRTFADRAITHGLSPLGPDVAGGLERLVVAGLIRARPDAASDEPAMGPDDPRGHDVREYEVPALVRDDALRRLDASGEAKAALWARANDLLALCELSYAELVIRPRRDLLDQLDTVHDDLIAALERARAAGESTYLIRMTGTLAEYWRSRGRLVEGRLWLDAALRTAPAVHTSERARALHGAGLLAKAQSDFRRAQAMLEEALAIRLEVGDEADAATTLNQLGLIGLELGDLEAAERHCRHGLEIRRALGDESAVAASLNTLGGILQFGGRTAEAAPLLEESLAIRRAAGDEAGASVSLGNLALVARDRGDLDAAETMLREAIATRERLDDRQRVALVRHNLALVLFDRGDLRGATAELERAVATARELGDRLETANALSDLGFVRLAADDRDRAAALQAEALRIAARIGAKGIVAQAIDGVAGLVARTTPTGTELATAAALWAAADAIRREARYHHLAADRRRIDDEIAAARVRADATAWEQATADGAALSLDEAIVRAEAALGSPTAATATTTPTAVGQVAV